MRSAVQNSQLLFADFAKFCETLNAEEAFIECFLDWIEQAYQALCPFVNTLVHVKNLLSEDTFQKILFEQMKQDLLPVVIKTCIYELHEAKANGYLTEAQSTDRFKQFIKLLKEPRTLEAIFKKYPVLHRLLKTYVGHSIKFMRQFFQALEADYVDIQQHFNLSESSKLCHIYKAGDRHRQASSVLILEFIDKAHETSVQKIVYKPRSLAIDLAYNYFISKINQKIDFDFRTVKTLDYQTHGWCEFVTVSSCQHEKEVERFYYRLGGLLAVAHLLNGGDLHYENVLAAGDCPIIIDHECLLQPLLRLNNAAQVQRLRRTLLDTLILPNRALVTDTEESFDVSAFAGRGGQFHPEENLVVMKAGCDDMRLERQRTVFSAQHNLPTLKGEIIDASAYQSHFIKGFETCYQWLLNNKTYLTAKNSPLQKFNHVETRILFKPTAEYARLLFEALHPKILCSFENFQEHLSWLYEDRKDYQGFDCSWIIASEIEDLHQLDIPLFSHWTDEGVIRNSRSQPLDNIILHNGFAALMQQVNAFSSEDFLFQSMLIKQALFASDRSSQKEEMLEQGRKSYINKKYDVKLFCLNKVTEILDYIKLFAFIDNGIPYWSYVSPVGSAQWSVSLSTFDLYNGILGVILTYAYASVFMGHARYKQRVLDFVEKLAPILETLNNRSSIGAYSGLGAFLIFIAKLNQLNFISTLQATLLIEKITTHFDKIFKDDYPIFDVIDGSAGYLLALLEARSLVDPKTLAKQLHCCVRHILKIYPSPGVMPKHEANVRYHGKTILGFAHGMMGVAYALDQYARFSTTPSVAHWINKACQLHQSSWSERQYNWPDVMSNDFNLDQLKPQDYSNSWCYGRIGQVLFYLNPVSKVSGSHTFTQVERCVIAEMKEGFSNILNMCHGDMGKLDFLLIAEKSGLVPAGFSQTQLKTKLFLDRSVDSICTERAGRIFIPGLMTGLSGVAYQLLRIIEPAKIPSILSWGLVK